MRRKPIHIGFITALVIALIAACSTEKDALINKGYHNMTARYNGYYNAQVLVEEALTTYRNSYRDDYSKLLPLDIYPTEEDATDLNPQLDPAIEKCEKVILRHSMPNPQKVKNKTEEHCRWIDDNWLVIAQIHYIKREYELAEQKFKYISKTYQGEESIYEAKIWLAKTYIAKGNYPEAARILAEVKVAIDEETARKEQSIKEWWDGREARKKDKERHKKNKTKPPARFPKRLMDDYEITMTELYIAQKDYKKAIEHLELGIQHCKNRKQRARYQFVLAQLYAREGNGQMASYYYNKVAHSNAPYEMQFKAKIHKALAATSGGQEIRDELTKMLKDAKNAEYRDQIYYALAELDMKDGDVKSAKENYTKSAFTSIDNDRQKGISYLKLADIHFNEKDYLKAQKYYDSCVQVLPKEYEDYDFIAKKAEGLSDLVFHYDTYVFEDSVQTIAFMPDKEREKFLEKTLKQIEEEEERKNAEEQRRLIEQQKRINDISSTAQGGSKWYFYNSKVKGSGFNDFRALWGQRILEDNWRRSNKTSSTGLDEEFTEGDSLAVEDSLTVDVLRADLPLTPEAMDSSNNRLMNSLYMLGIIYKERLDEPTEATKYFNLVVDRGVDHPKVLPAMYQLYLLHKNSGSSKAQQFKDKILSDYPDSEIAQILKDPDYLKKKEEEEKAEFNAYKEAYEDYRYRRFGQVITKCNEVINNDTNNIYLNKYYLLKAFAVAQVTPGNTSAIASPLQELYDLDPTSEEGQQAKIYLDMLNKGEKIIKTDQNEHRDNVFEVNLESEHFFILVFPNDKGNINPTKIQLSNFNREYFRNKNLKITHTEMGTDYQIILVKSFASFEESKSYLNTFIKPQSQLILGTMASDFQYFMINKKNFSELSITKNVMAYIEFYKQNYPQ